MATVGCISFAFLKGSCSALLLVQIMAGEAEWYVVSLGSEWREQGRWFSPGALGSGALPSNHASAAPWLCVLG